MPTIHQQKNVEHFYSFSDGKAALEHYKNFWRRPIEIWGESSPSTIVLLDINIPWMGGFEFLETIKDLPEEKKCESVITMLTSIFSRKRYRARCKITNSYRFYLQAINQRYSRRCFLI